METIYTLAVVFLAIVAGLFFSFPGFLCVLIIGAIIQCLHNREKKREEMQQKILDELKELKIINRYKGV